LIETRENRPGGRDVPAYRWKTGQLAVLVVSYILLRKYREIGFGENQNEPTRAVGSEKQ